MATVTIKIGKKEQVTARKTRIGATVELPEKHFVERLLWDKARLIFVVITRTWANKRRIFIGGRDLQEVEIMKTDTCRDGGSELISLVVKGDPVELFLPCAMAQRPATLSHKNNPYELISLY